MGAVFTCTHRYSLHGVLVPFCHTRTQRHIFVLLIITLKQDPFPQVSLVNPQLADPNATGVKKQRERERVRETGRGTERGQLREPDGSPLISCLMARPQSQGTA